MKFNEFIRLLQEKSNYYLKEINKGSFVGHIEFTKKTITEDKIKVNVSLYEGDRKLYSPATSHKTSMYIAILFAISELTRENRMNLTH
ncbi:MAG: hypothetical protein U5L09_13420 [Bacteroidales bacterium]|nr:hypothetical protein [Bacteroidales bacterium]